ncbi:hypothetical protein GCM10009682_35610 [Luedemannella flava]|uniref:Uncharacterized protein n=1 Tax=Luedemannella flava TaxID=349316 RepID=A0ABN2M6E4_9ACTN
MPGRDGVPDSPLGHLMCGDYLLRAPHAVWLFARTHALLLFVLVVLMVAARVSWRLWRRRLWRQAARSAVWLEIVPPVTATPAATYALWQLMATVLPASRRFTMRPGRLVWEVHATPTGMRAGLWVPAGINPTAVVRALHRAWPGVRAEQATPPRMAPERPTVGVALRSTQPDWLPLVEDATPPAARRWEYAPPEDDRIRAVYDGLAAAGRTGGGLLQVHVARAPRHRIALLRRASVNPHRVRRQRGGSRLLILALEALRAGISGLLDVVMPGPSGGRLPSGRTDPVVAEHARQARAKHAAGPHLLVAIRATATGRTLAAAGAAAADITSGYSLLSPHWRPRRLRRAVAAARWRWVPETAMHVGSAAETAALAGLPAEPSAYGLPAAGSRRLPASRDTFTAPSASSHTRPAPLSRQDAPSEQDAFADGDEPAMWSAP